ncbi:MAG: S-layer homology domain-containing protein [Candidatus Gracilibacteria bacterium]
MKKILGFILIGALFASTTAFAALKIFPDVPADAWYAKAVNSLSFNGVISGYPDGTFKPDNNINRAEVAAILSKYDEYQTKKIDDLLITRFQGFMTAQKQFANLSDVPEFFKGLLTLAGMGLKCTENKTADMVRASLVEGIGTLPTGWAIYSLPRGDFAAHYVNYTVTMPEGELGEYIDEWCGPY